MTSISTVYSTTQLTYSVGQIAADARSAQTATSLSMAAGLASSSDQLDDNIQKVQSLLALARQLNAQAIATPDGTSLLAPDSASAAALCARLQSIGVTDVPPLMYLSIVDDANNQVTARWISPHQLSQLKQTYGDGANGTGYYNALLRRAQPRQVLPADSRSDTDPEVSFFDSESGSLTFVFTGVINNLITPSQLIEWSNFATQQATTFTPQLEAGNANVQGRLSQYVDVMGKTTDSQEVSDRFLRDRDDSQLKSDTDYRAAVREVVGRSNRSNTKTST